MFKPFVAQVGRSFATEFSSCANVTFRCPPVCVDTRCPEKRLQLLKEEKSFGESLCYSQLLSIEGALEDAREMGWGGLDDELASVKDGPMGV